MANWITTKQASEQLGVSQRTIQRYIKQGLLKTKRIKGKTTISDSEFEAIKTGETATKQRQDKRQSGDKRHDTTDDSKEKVSPNWQPPEGYILIDKGTLDAIKNQLTDVTNELKEMRTTQQLLIEKGLNLRQLAPASDTTITQNDTTEPRQDSDNVAKVNATTDKKEHKNKATGNTTATRKKEKVVVAQAEAKNTPQATAEASIKSVKENKPEIKTIWQMMGGWFK